ncbi:MAG: DNA gyrase inhibitor YacG [Magnetospirillum sp.]|nr:DNA gyrase inhibitor YacG [Magnetospirillum sp.]
MTRAAKPCPVCGQPAAVETYRPFCSKRCADVDLHRWLGGVYRVETNEPPDDEDAPQPE